MKKLAKILMMTFMVIILSGVCVFASTESKNEVDPYDITKWSINLNKNVFEYDYICDMGGSDYDYHTRDFANDLELLYNLKYNTIEDTGAWIGYDGNSCVKWEVSGESYAIRDSSNNDNDFYDGYYPGKHVLKLTGIEPYYGTVEIPFTVIGYNIYSDNVSFYTDDYTYNGKFKIPKGQIIIKFADDDSGFGADKGQDYSSATYKYKNNKKVGIATAYVTIKFKGNFSGTVTKKCTFKICPKTTTFKKVKGYKKSVRLKWKKRNDITGYRVRIYKYSNDKMIDSYTFKNKKRTSLNITGLKRHSKYYVTVETYKKVKGRKIYSEEWGYKAVRTH